MRRCVFVTAAALAAASLSPSLVVLFLLLAVAGVANSVTQPAINLFVAEQIPVDRQGLGFGIKQSGIPAAILREWAGAAVLALPLGWRVTLVLCALAPIAVGLTLPREEGPHVSRRPRRAPVARAPAHRCRRRARHRQGPSALGAYLVASPSTWDRSRHGRPARRARERTVASSRASRSAPRPTGARLQPRGRGRAASPSARSDFALMASDAAASSCSERSWRSRSDGDGPASFNLAVVDSNRETPGKRERREPGPASTRARRSARPRSACWRTRPLRHRVGRRAVMTLLSAGRPVARPPRDRRRRRRFQGLTTLARV
jgi:hypothetical protein